MSRYTDNLHSQTNKARISDRERQVLIALANGLAQREIAEKLFIARCTVNTHIQNIYGKLQVSNSVGAVVMALRQGIIGLFDALEKNDGESYV